MNASDCFRLSFMGRSAPAGAFAASQYFTPLGDRVNNSAEGKRLFTHHCGIHPGGNSNLDFFRNGDGTFGYVIQEEPSTPPQLSISGVVFSESPTESRATPPAGVKLVLPAGYASDAASLVKVIDTLTQDYIDTLVMANGKHRISTQVCETLADRASEPLQAFIPTLRKPPSGFWNRTYTGKFTEFWTVKTNGNDIQQAKGLLSTVAVQLVESYLNTTKQNCVLLSESNLTVLRNMPQSGVIDATPTETPQQAPVTAPTQPATTPRVEASVPSAISLAGQQLFGETKAQSDMIVHLLNQITATSRMEGPAGEQARNTLKDLSKTLNNIVTPQTR